jgi:hypothetical protein
MYGCSLFGRNICVLKGIWEYVPQNRNISVSEFYAEIFEKTPLYTEDNFIDIKLRVIDIVDDHDPRSKRKSGILSKRHEIWTCGEPYISSGKYKSRIYLRSYVGGIKRFGDGKRYLTDSQHPAYLRVYSKRCEFIGFLNITGPKPKNNNEIVECFKGTTSNLERYYEDIILWANGERTVEVWNKQEKKHIPTIISEWDHCKNVSKELQKNYNEMKIRIQKAYLKRYEEFNQQSELYIRIRHKYGRLKYRRDN